eukprot:TRINITY_DN1201_c0_g2_i3.p1 TRINITY_DN1201_c0_g2~~TRINITY_DN1201_c0_g2_i3.p1  ORF type:complete len:412 (-),score=63.34 TRINITY_DN1201_c0_g2_i3:439-1674(-)
MMWSRLEWLLVTAVLGMRLIVANAKTKKKEVTYSYRKRQTVKLGHVDQVQLDDVEGGRSVDVVTISDETTGLPIFQIDDFLSEEECSIIKDFGEKPKDEDEMEDSRFGEGLPLWEKLKLTDEVVDTLMEEYDFDQDNRLDAEEMAEMLSGRAGLMRDTYNHTELLELEFKIKPSAEVNLEQRKLTKLQFKAVNWRRYLYWTKRERPQRLVRYSSQIWLTYDRHPVLQSLLTKVAAVTNMSTDLIKENSQDLQLLQYKPGGAHYACHTDNDPVLDRENYRILTFFIYLNDVDEGGETMFFGTNVTGSAAKDWTADDEYYIANSVCGTTTTHCPAKGRPRQGPFQNSAFVKPKMGRAVFWYNADFDEKGRGLYLEHNSLHAGCPTTTQTKWSANVWITAGPANEDWATRNRPR